MKNSLRIAVFGSGIIGSGFEKVKSGYEMLVATDGASVRLIKAGIVPDVAVGDFDSVTKGGLGLIRKKVKSVLEYPPEKDMTDLELAVDFAIGKKPGGIDIFGATGSRLDHSLGAVFLLEKISIKGIRGRIINDNNEITFLDGSAEKFERSFYRYFSVLSLSDSSIVSVRGAKYDLDNSLLYRCGTRGISNEVKGKICWVKVIKGKVLLIKSRD